MREKTLSSKYYKFYKIGLLVFVTLLLALYVIAGVNSTTPWFTLVAAVGYLVLLVKYWFPSFRNMLKGFRKVKYDSQYLYIEEPNYDIEIPLHQVKDVELISLDGIYKFTLYNEDQFGKAIYCKPSMWYPFNFPKIDKELDRIRYLIKKEKERMWANEQNTITISSQNHIVK